MVERHGSPRLEGRDGKVTLNWSVREECQKQIQIGEKGGDERVQGRKRWERKKKKRNSDLVPHRKDRRNTEIRSESKDREIKATTIVACCENDVQQLDLTAPKRTRSVIFKALHLSR